MFVLLELVNEDKDKINEIEAHNLMLAALEEKTLEETSYEVDTMYIT